MKKRFIAQILLVSMLVLTLNSCTKELRIDRHELSLRLEEVNKAYSIDPEKIIIDQKKQLAFFSLHKEDDCLLTLILDKSQRIKSFSLSINKSDWTLKEIDETFLPFCKEILMAFCLNEDIVEQAFIELNLKDGKTYSTRQFNSIKIEKYAFNLYTNDLSNVIECAYI